MIKLLFLVLCSALPVLADAFADYWYAGKAEVAVYDLQQSRYGENRPGTATLIFVTEPFSRQKHVKLDAPDQAGADRATVLKLNTMKKYNTGIYPYSVMSSAFTDLSSGALYKATTSIQEWCGHTFTQANLVRPNRYRYQGFSYFENAGDQDIELNDTQLTEALLLELRLGRLTTDTTALPLVPSQEMIRTLHISPAACPATLSWDVTPSITTLTVRYEHDSDLRLEITFDTAFPHCIQRWEEAYTRGGQRHVTTATLKTVQRLPYWEMNSTNHDHWRGKVGLE